MKPINSECRMRISLDLSRLHVSNLQIGKSQAEGNGKTLVPPVFARSQSPPPPTVWDRFAPAVRARRPPCHVPGAMRSGRERRLRPWGCAFQTSLASATSWAVASIAALRPEPTEGGGQGRGNSAQPSEPSVPGPGRSRCTVSLYKDTRVPVASFQRWLTGQLELSQAAIDEHKLKS